MFLQASQLVGRAVGAEDVEARVGTVSRLIFNPANGQLAACQVKTGGWFGQTLYLAPIDISAVTKDFIVIRQADHLTAKDELIRLKDLLHNRCPILGQKAQTQSGRSLGGVADVLLESTSWLIAKYYLRQMLNEQILPAEHVHSITPRAVIFFDRVHQATAQTIDQPEASIAT